MKINQGMKPAAERPPLLRERTTLGHDSFKGMIREQEGRLGAEQLRQLLDDMDRRGELLAKHRTFENLRGYKDTVRKFVQEAVTNGYSLQEHSGFLRGRERRHKLLKELDTQLIALTNEVMDQQKTVVDLLSRIGEVKGLLVNLYF